MIEAASREPAAITTSEANEWLLAGERATRAAVTVILALIALLTFAFSFGNIWALGLSLALLASLLDQTPGLQAAARPGGGWNGHAPLFRLSLPRPRAFCERLARAGVPNSVGTFGLVPAGQQPAFSAYRPAICPAAARLIDTTLAVVVTARDSDEVPAGVASS